MRIQQQMVGSAALQVTCTLLDRRGLYQYLLTDDLRQILLLMFVLRLGHLRKVCLYLQTEAAQLPVEVIQ